MDDNNKNQEQKKGKKLDNLINIVEKHTRTERHLEQYSNIGDPEYKEMARNKQNLREKQIDELKNQLKGVKNNTITKDEQIQDLKENYELGQGYLENNKNHMSQEDLENLEQRQENRKIQLENLEQNMKDSD